MKRLSLVGITMMVILLGFGAMAWAGEASVFDNVQGILVRVSTTCTSGCATGGTPMYSASLGAWDTEGTQFAGGDLVVTHVNGASTTLIPNGNNFLIHDNNLTSPDLSLSFDSQTGLTYAFCTDTDDGLHVMKFRVALAGAQPAGQCGSSNGGAFTSAPSTNLCSVGTPSSVTGSGPWSWTCAGAGGTANCSANKKVDGVCGSSNGGTFTSAPTTNLCSAGTPTSVTGSGPWNWSCTGLYTGSTANCTAQIQGTGGSPDLTVTSFSGIGSSYIENGSYNLSVTIKNQGTAPSGAFKLRGYLTSSTTPSPSSSVLFVRSFDGGLNAGQSDSGTYPVAPNGACAIHQYCNFIVVVDADNQVAESNESNNKRTIEALRTR